MIDPLASGHPVRLVWAQQPWRCPESRCEVAAFTDELPETASSRARVTSRGAWHTARRADLGRPVSETAFELSRGWRTVMRAVRRWGRSLFDADTGRLDGVTALSMERSGCSDAADTADSTGTPPS